MRAAACALAVVAVAGGCIDRSAQRPRDGGAADERTDVGTDAGMDAGVDAPLPPASTGPADVTATVDPTTRHQTLVGFGGAVAFDVNFLSAQSGAIYTTLFPDLGLDLLRVGNWYQNQLATGATDATAFSDTATVTVVQRATAALGHPPVVLMSSWSPPSYLKSNATTKGTRGSLLKDAGGAFQYAAFGAWWASALEAYAARGVRPDYISIQNEPDYFNMGWETCLLSSTEGTNAGYGPALDAVYAAVQADAALASKPKLVGPELAGIAGTGFSRYAQAIDATKIDAFAHHLYSGGEMADDPSPPTFDAVMGNVAGIAAGAGKPIFMTEFSPATPSLLNTAWLIHEALAVEGVAAYVYWDLIWAPQTTATSLVTIESAAPGSPFTINDPYYAVRHYAKFTDPGWTRVDATATLDAVKVSAFTSPDGGALTVVLINTDAADHTVAVDRGGAAFATTTGVYRSAAASSERTARLAPGGDGAVTLPAGAIATLTFGP